MPWQGWADNLLALISSTARMRISVGESAVGLQATPPCEVVDFPEQAVITNNDPLGNTSNNTYMCH